MFKFQNVVSLLLVISITALWAYTVDRDSMRTQYFKEEFSKIKTDQKDLAINVSSLAEDYKSVQSMLKYNEAGITITLEQLKETSSLLSDLSIIDSMLIQQLKDVKYGQGEAELLLEEVKKIALTKPVPQIIRNIVQPEKQITPVIKLIPTVIPTEIPIAPPIVEKVVKVCPSLSKDIKFGSYISKIRLDRSAKFVASYSVENGEITNLSFSGNYNKKIHRAVTRYLGDAIIASADVQDCSIPFKIEV